MATLIIIAVTTRALANVAALAILFPIGACLAVAGVALAAALAMRGEDA